MIENREEDREIGNSSNCNCKVADPVGVVIKHASLIPEGRANFTRISDRTAALRIHCR